MRNHRGSIVPWEDIRNYFRGTNWHLIPSDKSFEAQSETTRVSFDMMRILYDVSVASIDDSSDSIESKQPVEDPIQFIVKFLETGTEADEFYSKISSDVSVLSNWLRTASNFSEEKLSCGLRRVIVAMMSPSSPKATSAGALKSLRQEFQEKGWKVRDATSKNGLAGLDIDISGVYTAHVGLNSFEWEYAFDLIGPEDVQKTGLTTDPIQEYRNFYKNPDVVAAKNRMEETKPARRREVPEATKAASISR